MCMFERLITLIRGKEEPQEPIDYCPHRRSPILGNVSTEEEVRRIAGQHRGELGRVILNGRTVHFGVTWAQLGDGELFLDESGHVRPSYTY